MSANRVVYSTETGGLCPTCGRPQRKCRCGTEAPEPKGDGVLRLRREVKGRKGRTVILISGLPAADRARVCRSLQSACGCGGSVEGAEVLIQGDQMERIRSLLRAAGFQLQQDRAS